MCKIFTIKKNFIFLYFFYFLYYLYLETIIKLKIFNIMRKDMITLEMIWKDIRSYLALMFQLAGLITQLPSCILYSLANIVKNKEDKLF